jgi:prepilin-type N-terminal cleavage/methylation domain-containing protein
MNTKGGKTPLGYTIVEVLVVMAVSGAMFLIAANFISGKQEKTAFTQSVNEMASRIQDTITKVSAGQYSDIPLNCSWDGTTTTILPGSAPQGTNPSCVFLGKLISFAYPTTHNYQELSLAGGRADALNGTPTLSEVDPAIIGSLTTTQATTQQVDITDMTYTDTTGAVHALPATSPPATPSSGYYNVGFVQGLGTANGSGSFLSGAQSIALVYSTLDPTALSTPSNNLMLQTARSVSICMGDGTQSANLVIGTNNNQLSVDVQRFAPGVPCP